MIRTMLMLAAISGPAIMTAAEKNHTHECKVPEFPARTPKGAYVGVYYVDGVAQPGYCTASTKDGWTTTSSAIGAAGSGLTGAQRSTTTPKFTVSDQVCPDQNGKKVLRPRSSPGPTLPCYPPIEWLKSLGPAKRTNTGADLKRAN